LKVDENPYNRRTSPFSGWFCYEVVAKIAKKYLCHALCCRTTRGENLASGVVCEHQPALPAGTPLSSDEKIRVLVWNIFKQQRAEWLSVLKNFGKDAHLVLLQEAQTTLNWSVCDH
jgi:endonuclease/exonuclease/phosphatase (EEP) superfamily protein YafD